MPTVLAGIAVALALLLVARDAVARRRERALGDEVAQLRGLLKEHDRLTNVGQLVSGLAQDLKSPLQSMLGSAEVLAATEQSDGAAQEVRDIRENVTRAVGIVRNLLAFTETHALDKRWQDLNEVVQRALDSHRSEIAATGLRVELDGAARLPLVYIDGRQIEKVVATLIHPALNNGRQRAAGALVVSTRRGGATPADDRLAIDIDDPTLPLRDDEASWSGELDACRRVLEAHGGSLEIERQRTGGFRFHLELPVAAEAGTSQA